MQRGRISETPKKAKVNLNVSYINFGSLEILSFCEAFIALLLRDRRLAKRHSLHVNGLKGCRGDVTKSIHLTPTCIFKIFINYMEIDCFIHYYQIAVDYFLFN